MLKNIHDLKHKLVAVLLMICILISTTAFGQDTSIGTAWFDDVSLTEY